MLKRPPARSANIVITIVIMVLYALWYALRINSTIVNWALLQQYGASPWYILVTGIVWLLGCLGMLALLWKRHVYTIRAGLALVGLYTVWYWLDRLFVQPSPAPNWVFSAFYTAIGLLIYCFILITASV